LARLQYRTTYTPPKKLQARAVPEWRSPMSIEVAFFGFLAADAERRTSRTGKPWVRLRLGVGKDDAVQWVQVAVFGDAATAATDLKKLDRCYIEGTIRLDKWIGKDGVEQQGLSVAAFKCERTHRIGRNKPKRNGVSTDFQETEKPPATGTAAFNDEIPF
jgi:single-stranded DNA-binding protein